jgi:hypothetical protein
VAAGHSSLEVQWTHGQRAHRSLGAAVDLVAIGVIRHLADAERAWFRRYFRGKQIPEVYARPNAPNAAFDETEAGEAEADVGRLVAEWDASRVAVTEASLEDRFVHEQFGEMSLRGSTTT